MSNVFMDLFQESISTCRFAQRVAMIKNDVMVNEELDPKLMIQKLKREVQTLKEELALATGEQRTDALTDEELDRQGGFHPPLPSPSPLYKLTSPMPPKMEANEMNYIRSCFVK